MSELIWNFTLCKKIVEVWLTHACRFLLVVWVIRMIVEKAFYPLTYGHTSMGKVLRYNGPSCDFSEGEIGVFAGVQEQ